MYHIQNLQPIRENEPRWGTVQQVDKLEELAPQEQAIIAQSEQDFFWRRVTKPVLK